MYYNENFEDICYDKKHIEKVIVEIKNNFLYYFELYLEDEINKGIDKSTAYKNKIKNEINTYEKDREKYLEILDIETLEEHEDDPANFKNSVLKNECPIIRYTLHSDTKELDKYRADFRRSDPNRLLQVITNIAVFAKDYLYDIYDKEDYENIQLLEDLCLEDLDYEEYYKVDGVIGGGIKSYLLYKFSAAIFPNRSREALWAFWYLTGKKSFGCEQDSEFLIINGEKGITQQNYFYPYELFSFYAFNIFKLIKKETIKLDVFLNNDYRYVFVDSFLTFIAQNHSQAIKELQKSSVEKYYE